MDCFFLPNLGQRKKLGKKETPTLRSFGQLFRSKKKASKNPSHFY
jgi:hypothetical protein